MSRDYERWESGDDHGGQPGRHRGEPLGDGPGSDIQGWSRADVIAVVLLALLLVGVLANLVTLLTMGYCECPKGVSATA